MRRIFILLNFIFPMCYAQGISESDSLVSYDIDLLEYVTYLLDFEYDYEIRVDSRLLISNPGIVSFHNVRADEVTLLDSMSDTFLLDTLIIEQMKASLSSIGISETNAVKDAQCPGIMVPPMPEVVERRKRLCPRETYVSVVLAMPRSGGAYWPNNLDERAKYSEADVWSVRAILRYVSPEGSIESSWDYVLEFTEEGGIRLLEKQPLLIIE